ncbi:MAG TPA: NADP-dependent oxidoreductase [Bacteroidales bacterium]|nr:NADP-dependent oxidoreductase [Bacteroidales bacterium]
MKAIILEGFGGVENMVVSEQPTPSIESNEVLVQVRAIGINPVDIKTRQGKSLADSLKKFNPIVLGWDIAGTVIATGEDVTLFRNGDDVFGMINFPGHGKAYAEYVAAPEGHLALKPQEITFEEAAGACLAALTAWQVLKEKVKLKQGDKVLIHGGAGGVGHFAIQMAKYLGADVTTTASASNRDFVLSLGASLHIDYEAVPFETIVNDIDFVFDTIGGPYIDRSLRVLRKGGTIVCIPGATAAGLEEKAAAAGMTGSRFMVQSDGNNMREIASLLGKGVIKTHISSIFALDKVQEAHLQIETGKTKGKVVLSVQAHSRE